MKQLQITENNAMRLYNTASPEFKTALEDTFGKDFFHRDITERIKTYEDACELLGLDPNDMPDVSCVPEEDEKSHVAYHKLIIIARALNEGWRPNWKNTNEDKWFNWWYIDTNAAGFGCATSLCEQTRFICRRRQLKCKHRRCELGRGVSDNETVRYDEWCFLFQKH